MGVGCTCQVQRGSRHARLLGGWVELAPPRGGAIDGGGMHLPGAAGVEALPSVGGGGHLRGSSSRGIQVHTKGAHGGQLR
jgi:hypothetical protein